MDKLTLNDPLFATYVIAASLTILKAVAMSWLTVVRMVDVKGGYRSPEDIKKTPMNPAPDPAQLLPNERVERIRRIQMNDLEEPALLPGRGFALHSHATVPAARPMAAIRLRRLTSASLHRLSHRTDS